jgi:hypothetical protein
VRLILLVLACAACSRAPAPATSDRPAGWLKGQLHAHSSRSHDSRTPPEDVARWYAARGYDFLVLTDHNRVGGVEPARTPGLLVLPGVELTVTLDACTPPTGSRRCPMHVNALAVDRPLDAAPTRVTIDTEPPERLAIFARELELARALGGVAQLNHPNFHFVADADLLARLAGPAPLLVEIFNMSSDSFNEGDASHPSTEALWDAALDRGARIYATATDDAHHYDDAPAVAALGGEAHTGDRGFVMVRARREPAAIRAALAAGDFYASTGLVLDELTIAGDSITVRSVTPATISCVGPGGRVLSTVRGLAATCQAPPAGRVRARLIDDRGRRAWTQPAAGP